MEALAGRTISPDTIITLLSQLSKLQPDASERLQTLLSGASVKLCFNTLSADLTRFRGTADELLMLYVYLGLLTFDVETSTVHVPNTLAAETLNTWFAGLPH